MLKLITCLKNLLEIVYYLLLKQKLICKLPQEFPIPHFKTQTITQTKSKTKMRPNQANNNSTFMNAIRKKKKEAVSTLTSAQLNTTFKRQATLLLRIAVLRRKKTVFMSISLYNRETWWNLRWRYSLRIKLREEIMGRSHLIHMWMQRRKMILLMINFTQLNRLRLYLQRSRWTLLKRK